MWPKQDVVTRIRNKRTSVMNRQIVGKGYPRSLSFERANED